MPSYRIVIDTKSQTRKEKEKEQLENVSNGSNNKKESTDDKKVITKKNYVAAQAIDLAKTTALQVGKLYVDTIGVRTDNTARQNEVNNIVDLAGKGISAVGSIAAGAAMGGVPGAVIAAVAVAVNEAVNIASNVMQYRRDIAEDAASTMHASERLGMVATDRNRRR